MTKAKALTAYLAERQPAPFDWRTANCAHFAAGFVARVEGRDVLAALRMPTTLGEARRRLRRGGGLQRLVTHALNREPIAAPFAQVGDVVLLRLSETDAEAMALGLCCGEYAAAATEDGGVTHHPMTNAVAAWRVG